MGAALVVSVLSDKWWAVPIHLANSPIPPVVADAIRYGVFVLLLIVMAAVPIEKSPVKRLISSTDSC